MALGEVYRLYYNVETILLVYKIATAITSCVHCLGGLRVDVAENYFAITITITIRQTGHPAGEVRQGQ